jgi:hypothetical protein
VYKAYSFQWLQFKQQPTGDGIKAKLNNDMAQVALVLALALTIWMSILFGDYSGRSAWNGDPIEQWKLSVLILILWTATFFQCLSVINAVFLSMMYGVCVTKTEVEDFDKRLPLASRRSTGSSRPSRAESWRSSPLVTTLHTSNEGSLLATSHHT